MSEAAVGTAAATQPPENVTYIPFSELKELCNKALSTLGYSTEEIAVLNEVGAALWSNKQLQQQTTHVHFMEHLLSPMCQQV